MFPWDKKPDRLPTPGNQTSFESHLKKAQKEMEKAFMEGKSFSWGFSSLTVNGKPVKPKYIEMVYWFSNFPTSPLTFSYSQDQFEADEEEIINLVQEIKSIGEGEAPKTENEKRCKFCAYRSLCNRGIAAGTLNELEDEFDRSDDFSFELDFEQIAEIAF